MRLTEDKSSSEVFGDQADSASAAQVRHRLAPFCRWSKEAAQVSVTTPDYDLRLAPRAEQLLKRLKAGWVSETEEISALHEYGVSVSEAEVTSQTEFLFRLEKYFARYGKPIKATKIRGARGHSYSVAPPDGLPVGTGQDRSRELALLKAAVEFYERISCDDSRNQHLLGAKLEKSYRGEELMRFSHWQYRMPGFPYRREPSGVWARVENPVTGAPASIPFELVCYPHRLEGPICGVVGSNGVAAHTDWDEAVLRSVYELIERDALMIHWFGELARERIRVPSRFKQRVARMDSHGYDLSIVNLTLDLAPVVLVVCLRRTSVYPRMILGMSAQPRPMDAIDKALTDVEMHLKDDGFEPERRVESVQDISDVVDHYVWYNELKNLTEVAFFSASTSTINVESIHQGPRTVRDMNAVLSRGGFDWYVARFNPRGERETGVSVVRSIVPGLVPISFGFQKDPLGMARLRELPHQLGGRFKSRRRTKCGYKPQPFA